MRVSFRLLVAIAAVALVGGGGIDTAWAAKQSHKPKPKPEPHEPYLKKIKRPKRSPLTTWVIPSVASEYRGQGAFGGGGGVPERSQSGAFMGSGGSGPGRGNRPLPMSHMPR